MSTWIQELARRPIVTVNVLHGFVYAMGGDPTGKDRGPLLWALLGAILGGVASGVSQEASAFVLGS
ncbi:hypothetical protein [Streptomyces sp. NPDC002851]